MHSGVFEALPDASHLVGRQVIDDNSAAGLHLWDQAFLKPLAEDHAVHPCPELRRRGTWQKLWGEDAVMD